MVVVVVVVVVVGGGGRHICGTLKVAVVVGDRNTSVGHSRWWWWWELGTHLWDTHGGGGGGGGGR